MHPKYLDNKGLVALWRETLLAKHVLEGKTSGQMNYETTHLIKKLKVRNPKMFLELINFTEIEPHPLFKVVEGNIEGWESLKKN